MKYNVIWAGSKRASTIKINELNTWVFCLPSERMADPSVAQWLVSNMNGMIPQGQGSGARVIPNMGWTWVNMDEQWHVVAKLGQVGPCDASPASGMSAPVMVMFSKSQPVWHPSLHSETSWDKLGVLSVHFVPRAGAATGATGRGLMLPAFQCACYDADTLHT